MDSTGRTYEDFLKEPHWNASNSEWDEAMEREEKLDTLDSMARNIELYRMFAQRTVNAHKREIYIKCQVRWMQRYIKLAEIIF